jgi:hypothetical protein
MVMTMMFGDAMFARCVCDGNDVCLVLAGVFRFVFWNVTVTVNLM